MNITAVWLVLTVAILNLHKTTSQKKPSMWIRSVAFNILPKILHTDIPNTDNTECNDTETLNSKLSQPNEWDLLGRVFDQLCLYIFAFVDVIAFVILILHCRFPTPPHPNTLPREQSKWVI